MKNLINNIISKFKKNNQEEQAIVAIYNQLQNANDHLIAIARLSLIKPDVLVREARNIKSNGEYLLKMIEAQKEIQADGTLVKDALNKDEKP